MGAPKTNGRLGTMEENLPEGLKEVVTLTNLSRAFMVKKKPVVALSNLNLSLYEAMMQG